MNQIQVLADLGKIIKLIEEHYGRDKITPNLHLSLHLQECSHDFGPLYTFWCFSFERMNRILGNCNFFSLPIYVMRRLMNDNLIREISSSVDIRGLNLL